MEPAIDSSTGHLALEHLLKQRYRILDVVGQGGFGAVYKAQDTRSGNRFVAVKEMSKSGLMPQQIAEATDTFKREALLLAGLSHPHLPRLYDHFTDADRWYVVMDFIVGETLEEHLLKTAAGYLPLEQVLEIGIQLCAVLDYLHTRQQPVIFRDVKPANIMLTPSGSLYLIDFGVARYFKPGQTKDTIPFGSPGYAAPEQYGRAQTTPHSDIYSLGVTLYQLLTGIDPSQAPFHFAPLELPEQPTPAGLEPLIMQMLEMDQSKRPASMVAVKQALEQIAAHHIAQPSVAAKLTAIAHAPLTPPQPLEKAILTLPHAPKRGFVFSIYHHHRDVVRTLAWSPDGQHIASAGEDRTVQVWEVATGHTVLTYHNHSDVIYAVAWAPDGQRIASASDDRTVRVWDMIAAPRWLRALALRTGFKCLTYGHQSGVHALAWSPNGQYLVSAGNDHIVQVRDAITGEIISSYGGHSDLVWAVACSPNNKRIASASTDHTLRVWDMATGRKVFIHRNHASVVHAVAWSPDGRRIASSSSDHTVRIWEVTSERSIFTYRGHTDRVHAVAWSPDGKYIASGSHDTTVQVWEVTSGRNVFTHHGHADKVYTVAWSPNGQRIASGGSDQTVQVWQAV